MRRASRARKVRFPVKRTILLAVCLALLAAPALAVADVFYYVDERGVYHFADHRVTGRYRLYRRERSAPAYPVSAPSYLRSVASAEVNRLIDSVAGQHGIDADLVRAVVKVESNFDTNAVSRKGARGLMQLMPETAANYGVQDAHDPAQNLEGGVRHLCELMIQYNGELPLTLAAYNAGKNSLVTHGGVPPYRETQRYIREVIDAYRRYSGRR
jgi:soluble lytic murein transglycosylase-like protein